MAKDISLESKNSSVEFVEQAPKKTAADFDKQRAKMETLFAGLGDEIIEGPNPHQKALSVYQDKNRFDEDAWRAGLSDRQRQRLDDFEKRNLALQAEENDKFELENKIIKSLDFGDISPHLETDERVTGVMKRIEVLCGVTLREVNWDILKAIKDGENGFQQIRGIDDFRIESILIVGSITKLMQQFTLRNSQFGKVVEMKRPEILAKLEDLCELQKDFKEMQQLITAEKVRINAENLERLKKPESRFSKFRKKFRDIAVGGLFG